MALTNGVVKTLERKYLTIRRRSAELFSYTKVTSSDDVKSGLAGRIIKWLRGVDVENNCYSSPQKVIRELRRLEELTSDFAVANMLENLIEIFKEPMTNLPLIRQLMMDDTSSPASGVTSEADEEEYRIWTSEKRIACDTVDCVDLDIWSDEVNWDNDYNCVRIYLPIFSHHRTVTLSDVSCSILHLELGHQLKINYPGVAFSVLINHSTITGVVEAKLSSSQLIIRISKSVKKLWAYLTFVSYDVSYLTFHLNSQYHLTTRKNADLMVLVQQEQLEPPSPFCLSAKGCCQFIWQRFKINPEQILSSEKTIRTNFTEDTSYKNICQCQCNTCLSDEKLLLSNLITLPRKVGPVAPMDIRNVWWQNDKEKVKIHIPMDPSLVDNLKYECCIFEFGIHLKLILGESHTLFSTFIYYKLAEMQQVTYSPAFAGIFIHLPKMKDDLWPFVSLVTREDTKYFTYNLNPFYSLKFNSDSDMSPNLAHAMNQFLSKGLKFGEILEILQDACSLHYCTI